MGKGGRGVAECGLSPTLISVGLAKANIPGRPHPPSLWPPSGLRSSLTGPRQSGSARPRPRASGQGRAALLIFTADPTRFCWL